MPWDRLFFTLLPTLATWNWWKTWGTVVKEVIEIMVIMNHFSKSGLSLDDKNVHRWNSRHYLCRFHQVSFIIAIDVDTLMQFCLSFSPWIKNLILPWSHKRQVNNPRNFDSDTFPGRVRMARSHRQSWTANKILPPAKPIHCQWVFKQVWRAKSANLEARVGVYRWKWCRLISWKEPKWRNFEFYSSDSL